MNPGSAWGRLASLGADAADPIGERRRVALTNQGAFIAVVSCGAFGTGFALGGPEFRLPAIVNACAVAFQLVALGLARARRRTLAKLAVLLPLHVVIIVVTLHVGLDAGTHYYFFLFAAVSFLFFGEDQRAFRRALALVSLVSCLFVCVAAPASDTSIDLSPRVALALDLISAFAVITTMVFIVELFTSDTTRAEARLAEEHARSERLLLNILPSTISARLKDGHESIADGFAEVTVLFADLVGFTELSQRLSPSALVDMLNSVFSAFDDLAEKLSIEKIKTIGDCYMVAAGLPVPRADHAEAAARMALGMREALARINQEGGYSLRLRIGLHLGPVIAGVIGKRKFIYDLWGDTVNTASRMESSGLEQEIQVTREVYDRLVGKFELDARGTIKVKGKGELETFLLRGELRGPAPAKLSG